METKKCHTCGETKPIRGGFYDYRKNSGVVLSQCRDCLSVKNSRRWLSKQTHNAADKIKYIGGCDKSQRANILFSMVTAKEITRDQFRVVCREVEL